MDKKYMGKFISSIREEKKLTQEEIANNLGVSVKIIKKIEKGKFKLESPIIVPLCNELGITIYEFLNGRKGDDRIDQMDALNVYSDYLKKKRFKKIIKMVLGFIFILFYVFALIWMNNNKDLAYELYGESKNFSYKQSFFLRDNRFYLFVFGNGSSVEISVFVNSKSDFIKWFFNINDNSTFGVLLSTYSSNTSYSVESNI